MKLNKNKMLVATAIASACFTSGAGAAGTFTLPAGQYFTYGNTNSYSLPVAAYYYDQANGGGTGPGTPYYVGSSPGAIKDLVVIYTGASGTDVTTNAMGFEDAYGTPNGSSPQFASTDGTNVTSPTGVASKGIQTVYSNTWDASLDALSKFLNGGTPIFFFNNNDTNKDQDLAIWAKLWITDANGNLVNRFLYLSNQNINTNTDQPYGTPGVPAGDATIYNPGGAALSVSGSGAEGGVASGGVSPTASGTSPYDTSYVRSGGDVLICDATQVVVTPSTPCSGKTTAINHNLGANQVAYAADLPLLDTWLADLVSQQVDLSKYSLHLQLNLGCDSQFNGACTEVQIDNGYEQLFMGSSNSIYNTPEPATLSLMGLGLLGAFASLFRRKTA
ncbi:MAG: PEP-CTERM sorting domain-containing protein [Proteobacteria bacterium]|nr:PEP-CTERM sorting domain-containing protein [Pseudomonadota bacterium]